MTKNNKIIQYILKDDLRKAVDASIEISEQMGNKQLIRESLIIASRFSEIEKGERSMIFDENYIQLEKNKLRKYLLELANVLGHPLNTNELETDSREHISEPDPKNHELGLNPISNVVESDSTEIEKKTTLFERFIFWIKNIFK